MDEKDYSSGTYIEGKVSKAKLNYAAMRAMNDTFTYIMHIQLKFAMNVGYLHGYLETLAKTAGGGQLERVIYALVALQREVSKPNTLTFAENEVGKSFHRLEEFDLLLRDLRVGYRGKGFPTRMTVAENDYVFEETKANFEVPKEGVLSLEKWQVTAEDGAPLGDSFKMLKDEELERIDRRRAGGKPIPAYRSETVPLPASCIPFAEALARR